MLGPPLENHWINVADGVVESVSDKPSYSLTQHLGEANILPAGVNAHTHLELSKIVPSPLDVPSRAMSDWVTTLLNFRRCPGYNAAEGIQHALHQPELLNSTIAVADIVPAHERTGVSPPVLDVLIRTHRGADAQPLLRYFPFTELIAWQEELVEEKFAHISPDSFGLSPHAPHTVCPALLEKAVNQNMPIAMHLAETQEELELLHHHTGPLLEMMRRVDPDYDPKSVLLGKRPMDYLQLLSAAPNVLIIHGNYLNDKEMQFLAAHRETMSVVYCPRSHAYFRHTPYPLQKMLDYGVRVLLGTDSLASVPDLNFVEEIRFVLKHHPTISPDIVYRLGMIEGASALHLRQEGFGTIQSGSPARFAVL